MDIQDLRVFISVYDARNLLHASDALNRDPSTVSWRIARLEREIGSPLFVRLPQGVRPTEKADALYRVALRALAAMEDVERVARDTKGAA
jgi:DNA-binding transcriptional LysR family regulator